jgi:hypothetical protein
MSTLRTPLPTGRRLRGVATLMVGGNAQRLQCVDTQGHGTTGLLRAG